MVGLWKDGRVEILENVDDGLSITPSVVSFRPNNTHVVGNPAITQMQKSKKPVNTIYDAKRLVG